jgi:REP element-mobilizing transposase RayT
MPPRPPIDPQGIYHVSSRGSYGQPLFRTPDQYELFLMLYARAAKKYDWKTLEWVLMLNHHHFLIELTEGGLSQGMREVHGSFSRRIHAIYGLTGQGHLVRHGFFARQLKSDGEVLVAARYVDLNATGATGERPERAAWSGYAATIGLAHPRPFHQPSELLKLVSAKPSNAQAAYRSFVEEGLVGTSHGPSPNDGLTARD